MIVCQANIYNRNTWGVLELLSYIARLVERDRGGLSNHIADISSDIAILIHT